MPEMSRIIKPQDKKDKVVDKVKPSFEDLPKDLPINRVNSGEVSLHKPSLDVDLDKGPDPTGFIMNYEGNEDQNLEEVDTPPEEELDEPEEPTTLPAIIQTALSTDRQGIKSYQMANIISQAPHQFQQQLQKIGRDIFSQHSESSKTLKDIYVICSLTSSETEVKLMLAWILMHGRKISDARYSFPSMPGYRPKAELWEVEDARFLVVRESLKDFAGEEIEATFDDPDFEEKVDNKQCIFYIYGWDEIKKKLNDDALSKRDLLEVATRLVKRSLGQTVQECYETLILEYMREGVDFSSDKKKNELEEARKYSSYVNNTFTSIRRQKYDLLKACGIPCTFNLGLSSFNVTDPETGITYNIFDDTGVVQFRFKSPEIAQKYQDLYKKIYPSHKDRVGTPRQNPTEFLTKRSLSSDLPISMSYRDFMQQLAADVDVLFIKNIAERVPVVEEKK